MDFEEKFMKSANKAQKAAFREIKRLAPREWSEFEMVRRMAEKSWERGLEAGKPQFLPVILMITNRIIQKAPAAALVLNTFGKRQLSKLPKGKKTMEGILQMISPMEKEAIMRAKKAAPKEWEGFESSIFDAVNGGGLPAWIRLIVNRDLLERAAPKESKNLIRANKETRKAGDREMEKEGGWKPLRLPRQPN